MQDSFDFVQDGFREQQVKPRVEPRFVDLCGEAIVGHHGATQEDLRIKNDAHVGLSELRHPSRHHGLIGALMVPPTRLVHEAPSSVSDSEWSD